MLMAGVVQDLKSLGDRIPGTAWPLVAAATRSTTCERMRAPRASSLADVQQDEFGAGIRFELSSISIWY